MDEVKKELIEFQRERDWKKFHTPENLAKSISIESAELLEHFQWQKDYDIDEVAEELADVLIYSLYMADALDLDIKEIILDKMKKNAEPRGAGQGRLGRVGCVGRSVLVVLESKREGP